MGPNNSWIRAIGGNEQLSEKYGFAVCHSGHIIFPFTDSFLSVIKKLH